MSHRVTDYYSMDGRKSSRSSLLDCIQLILMYALALYHINEEYVQLVHPSQTARLAIQCETSFHRIRIVAPPVWHRDLFARPEEEEDEEHVEVEPSVESSCHQVVVALPHLKVAPVGPVHNNVPADDGRGVTGTDIAVEHRQSAKEDADIPEIDP